MKKIIIIIILISSNVFSQKKIYVLDSVTKQILPFAEVKLGKKGLYTNEKGYFIINDTIKKGKIYFLGYKSKSITFKSDTIFLIPKIFELNEIILSQKKESFVANFLHSDKKYFSSFPLSKNKEILTTIIPKSNKIIGKLESVSFKLNKIIFDKKKYSKTSKAFIRINIYTNDSNQTKLYASKPYVVNKDKKDLVTIDLKNTNIKMPKAGLTFGVEYIGHIDKNGNFIDDSKLVIRPYLVDKNSSLYEQTTFLRDFFTKKIIIQSFNNYFYSLNKKKVYNRNLSISFVICKS